jgi:hypothetical protein
MHSNSNYVDQASIVRALTGNAPSARSGCDSPAEDVGLMPFIHVGTFLVASYLRSRPRDNPSDSSRAARKT